MLLAPEEQHSWNICTVWRLGGKEEGNQLFPGEEKQERQLLAMGKVKRKSSANPSHQISEWRVNASRLSLPALPLSRSCLCHRSPEPSCSCGKITKNGMVTSDSSVLHPGHDGTHPPWGAWKVLKGLVMGQRSQGILSPSGV